MSQFYMLAGTVSTADSLQQLQQRLSKAGLETLIDDDELEINGDATLIFRQGFDHEYILVGDSGEKETLITAAGHLSDILKTLGLQHGLEVYDTQNLMIDEFEFTP